MKQKRKSQLCDDHHRFENGTRFEGLLHFEAVTSGLPTIWKSSSAALSFGGSQLLLTLQGIEVRYKIRNAKLDGRATEFGVRTYEMISSTNSKTGDSPGNT